MMPSDKETTIEQATAGDATAGEATPVGWRFPVGVTIFVAGFAAPLAIPLVTSSNLPTAWKTAISGALALGVPEVMMVVAAAVMGKRGFAELKQRFGRFFKKYGPPEQVSRTRYRFGLIMFTLPLLLAWLAPYIGHHLPGYGAHHLLWAVTADIVFVASFFVLGGEFWDKLRALFVREARVVLPSTRDVEGGNHE
jgi:hypothetical protein